MDFETKALEERIKEAALAKETEKIGDSDVKYLYEKSTNGLIKKATHNQAVNAYLSFIKFDENAFEPGTVGRVLCLRNKLQPQISLYFCEDSAKLYQCYIQNIGKYEKLLQETKIFLENIINQRVDKERNRKIVFALLGIDGEKYTLETLGKRYDITRERVRQIFNNEVKRLLYAFNLSSESGVLRAILRQNYFALFADCPFDTFILYLHIEKQEYLLKALYGVLSRGISLPTDLEERAVKTAQSIRQEKQKQLEYDGFQVILGADGEVFTDLELLSKLNNERGKIAQRLGVPTSWVYRDKQMVLLSTYKPLNKDMYASLKGFTEATWVEYGSVMVKVIKEHIENSVHIGQCLNVKAENEQTNFVNMAMAGSMVGKAWSNDEENKLIEEYKQGLTISKIAKLHNRKSGGIRARLRKLGLIE